VREAGVYRSLAAQLPMATPALIAADPAGNWLVLEAVEGEAGPDIWDRAAREHAVDLLARLHERFWDLAEDLGAYPWLARPLTLDFEIHVYGAAQALGQIVRDDWPPLIARSARTLSLLGQAISAADQVAQPLRALPFTLLHGDYWEASWLRDEDGDLVVLNWHMASIGPGVLDLVTMLTMTELERGPLSVPLDALADRYRQAIAGSLGRQWSDDEWMRLWNHAHLWRFLQEMLGWAAYAEHADFAARQAQFEAVWLEPALATASQIAEGNR
jgi:hypothetical protein